MAERVFFLLLIDYSLLCWVARVSGELADDLISVAGYSPSSASHPTSVLLLSLAFFPTSYPYDKVVHCYRL